MTSWIRALLDASEDKVDADYAEDKEDSVFSASVDEKRLTSIKSYKTKKMINPISMNEIPFTNHASKGLQLVPISFMASSSV